MTKKNLATTIKPLQIKDEYGGMNFNNYSSVDLTFGNCFDQLIHTLQFKMEKNSKEWEEEGLDLLDEV